MFVCNYLDLRVQITLSAVGCQLGPACNNDLTSNQGMNDMMRMTLEKVEGHLQPEFTVGSCEVEFCRPLVDPVQPFPHRPHPCAPSETINNLNLAMGKLLIPQTRTGIRVNFTEEDI